MAATTDDRAGFVLFIFIIVVVFSLFSLGPCGVVFCFVYLLSLSFKTVCKNTDLF